MKTLLPGISILVMALSALCVESQTTSPAKSRGAATAESAIRAVLDAQAAAWNRGDLEGYMDGYDRSPDTEFVGGDTVTRG